MNSKLDHEDKDIATDQRALWLCLFGLLFIIFIYLLSVGKRKKGSLVQYYNVDKKTFNKWLQFFCPDIISNMEEYKRKRTISFSLYYTISTRLGNPNLHPILTKKEIVRLGEGTYSSLRSSVENYPDRFGLPSYHAFRSLKKFPPNISQRILMQFG